MRLEDAGAQTDSAGRGRNGSEDDDRRPAGLGQDAVADRHEVDIGVFGLGGEVEQIVQ